MPSSGGSSGGSIPDPITVPVTIQPTDDSGSLLAVDASSGQALNVKKGRLEFTAKAVDASHTLFTITAPNAADALSIEVNNDGSPGDVLVASGPDNIHEVDAGSIRLFGPFDGNDNIQFYATKVFTGGTLLQIEQARVLFKGVHAEPDDAQIATRSFGLWLDDTPGAAKLMIKAKDVNGTVVTGEIALT